MAFGVVAFAVVAFAVVAFGVVTFAVVAFAVVAFAAVLLATVALVVVALVVVALVVVARVAATFLSAVFVVFRATGEVPPLVAAVLLAEVLAVATFFCATFFAAALVVLRATGAVPPVVDLAVLFFAAALAVGLLVAAALALTRVDTDFVAASAWEATARLRGTDARSVAVALTMVALVAATALRADDSLGTDVAFFTAMLGSFKVALVVVPTNTDRWREDKAITPSSQWETPLSV